MTPTQMAFTLPLATLSTLLFVVACANSAGDSAPVLIHTGRGSLQSLDACTRNLKVSEVVKVGAQAKTVPVCSAKIDPVTKKAAYSLNEQSVRYKISKSSNQEVHVGIDADFSIPESYSADDLKAIDTMIKSCASKIAGAIATEPGRIPVISAQMNTTVSQGETTDDDAGFIQAKLVESATGGLVLEQWPDSPRLFVKLTPDQQSQCRGSRASECRDRLLADSNLPFCMTLARMVGHWMGLENADEQRCQVTDSSAKPNGSPAPQRRRQGYMRAASTGSASDFFSSEELSMEDVSVILTPACKAFGAKHP